MIDCRSMSMGSQRIWLIECLSADCWLTQSKDNWSVKVDRDCGCEDEGGSDTVKPIVSDSTHRINVILAFINIKRCRTSWNDDI